MVERIEGLPGDALGFRVWGTVTREEYDTQLLPPLEAAVADGGPIRCLLQIGPEFEGLTPGAMWEDAKEGLHLLRSHDQWVRTAVVTDVEWIVRTIGLLGWMAPGEVRTFALGERDAAITWVGG